MEKQVNIGANQDKQDTLSRISPIIKIIIVILITITTTLDRNPYFSILLFIYSICILQFISNVSILEYLSKLKGVFLIAIVYSGFILLSKRIGNEFMDFEYAFALGFRFVLIAGYSMIFVNSVNPKEFVMSLIKYFKMSERLGFAFLAAYRFFPTFSEELEQIKFSHATRGVGDNGRFSWIKNMTRYSIPMLVTAIRKGTRLSISMESRGFGKYPQRTYYKKIGISNLDKKAIIFYCIIYLISLIVFIKLGLLEPSIRF